MRFKIGGSELIGGFAGLALMSSWAATAQQSAAPDQAGVLEEITVTARKQSESLINVPVTVSAVSASGLNQAAINDLTKLGSVIPQVAIFEGQNGSGATFSIRGLGSSFVDAGVEQTVSLAIDGVQVGRGNIVTQGFFDLNHVEVLKGPQALFFGKNSPAGVVSIQTQDPTNHLEGYVRAGYEFDAVERYFEGALSIPVSETFKLRVAGKVDGMDGYFTNIAQGGGAYVFAPEFTQPGPETKKEPNSHSYAGRLTALWTPNDVFTAKFKLISSQYRDHGPIDQWICAPPQAFFDTIVAGPDPYIPCGPPKGNIGLAPIPPQVAAGIPGMRDGLPFRDIDTTLASVNLDYTVGNVTFTSLTGYLNLDVQSGSHGSPASIGILPAYIFESNHTFTQELRATSNFGSALNFTAGAYYERANFDTGTTTVFFPTPKDPVTGFYSNANSLEQNANRAYSLFGQLRWSIASNLELAGGARWTRETKDGLHGNSYVNPLPAYFGLSPSLLFLPTSIQLTPSVEATNVSPEATLSWHPKEDMTVYAAFKTGYKSGGISNPIVLTGGFTSENLTFKSETVKGGEIGIKGLFADRTVRASLTAYLYDYENLQVSSYNALTHGFLVQNAAAARVKGIEEDIEWRATPELMLNLQAGYNDARYTSFPNAPCGATPASVDPTCTVDIGGGPLANAPKWAGNAGATYDLPITGDTRLSIHADVSITSRYATEPDDAVFQSGFAKYNASVRFHALDDRWEVSLIGRNLANKYTMNWSSPGGYGGVNQYQVGVARPRQVVLEGTMRF